MDLYSTAHTGDSLVPRLAWVLRVMRQARQDILHYHSTDWRGLVALRYGRRRRQRLLVSHHGERLLLSLADLGRVKRAVIKRVYRDADGHIACGERILEALVAAGVPAERVAVIPAFIPPDTWDSDRRSLPEATRDFLRVHQPVLSLISRVNRWQGECLYGDDMAIHAVAALKSRYPEIGLLYRCHDVVDSDLFAEVIELSARLGVEDRIHVMKEPSENMNAMLAASTVHLRPTNTDGDSLIVREALALGVPVICSDVVRRPEGAILFASRGQAQFEATVADAIQAALAGSCPPVRQANYGHRVFEVYDRLLRGATLGDIRDG